MLLQLSNLQIAKLYEDHRTLSNEQYINDCLVKKVEVLTELSHTLHTDGIKMPSWKTFRRSWSSKESITPLLSVVYGHSSLAKTPATES